MILTSLPFTLLPSSFIIIDINKFTNACKFIQVEMSINDIKYMNNINQCENILGYLSNNIEYENCGRS